MLKFGPVQLFAAGARRVCSAAFVILLCAIPTVASPLGSGVSSGLADTHPADMGRVYAMEWNPAILGVQRQSIQFTLTPFTARVASDQAAIGPILRHLFSPASANKELEIPQADGEYLDLVARSSHRVQIGLGPRGVAVVAEGYARGTFTSDFLDLMGHRIEPGRSYAVAGSTADWAGYISMAASTAFPVMSDRLYFGVTLKALDGWTFGQAWVEGDSISIDTPEPTALFHAVQATRGQGYTFDFGIALRVSDHVTADMSWLNTGRILWEDPVLRVYTFDPDATTGTLKQVDERSVAPIAWHTPRTVRAGLSVQANPAVRWGFNVERAVSQIDDPETRFSVGAETTRVPLLALRVGVRYSSATQELIFATGAGLHLGPLTIDIGIPNISALLNGGREAGIAVSTGIVF